MKTSALVSLDFTVDVWDFTSTQDPITGNGTRDYFFVGNTRCRVVPGTGPVIYIFTREPLRRAVELKNLKDRNGSAVVEKDLVVQSSSPQVSVMGYVEGYKATVS